MMVAMTQMMMMMMPTIAPIRVSILRPSAMPCCTESVLGFGLTRVWGSGFRALGFGALGLKLRV